MYILTPLQNFRYPYLFSDAIYQLTPTIIRRCQHANETEILVNRKISVLIIFIEHRFGMLKNVFKLLGSSKFLHIGDKSVHTTFSTFILFNCHTCLRVSGIFVNVDPPSLEEYLPVDEDFTYSPNIKIPDNYVHGKKTL